MDVKRFGRFETPGHALTGDRTRRSRRVGWEYVHSIVDDCSRLAYSEIHDDERAPTVKALLHARAIDHLRTRPYTPRTNGKVERYQQTLQREWAYALEYASSDARRASLPHWVHHYNERRTHSALGNRPPIARVRDVTGHNT
jgi:transposase InsO family protein